MNCPCSSRRGRSPRLPEGFDLKALCESAAVGRIDQLITEILAETLVADPSIVRPEGPGHDAHAGFGLRERLGSGKVAVQQGGGIAVHCKAGCWFVIADANYFVLKNQAV